MNEYIIDIDSVSPNMKNLLLGIAKERIVRCLNCEYRDCYPDGEQYCGLSTESGYKLNDYCSWGERKKDE